MNIDFNKFLEINQIKYYLKKFLVLVFSLIFILVIFMQPRQAISKDEDIGQEKTNDLYAFALNATIGTLIHEIGHLLIDVYEIPIFVNEEDVADSFLSYYLINLPDQFDNLETYELFSEIDHNVLIDTADFYYFNTLLGKDLDDDFSTHSTDNRRFFNILCNMQNGNPEFFEEYLNKRKIAYLLEDHCLSTNFNEMRDAWFNFVSEYWIRDLDKISKQFIVSFEKNEDMQIFENFFNDSYGLEYLDTFQIKLPYPVKVSFKNCDEINAFYSSADNEIMVCYELITEYFFTRYDILDLKDSL